MNNTLNIPLGISPTNEVISFDLAEAPHCLVAGTTGSGKSTFLHSMICSLLMKTTPDELMFMLIDSKSVELTLYDGIPNLLTPCITDAWDAIDNLKALVATMEQRYKLAKEYNVKDLIELNEKLPTGQKLPYILVVVDEVADLIMLSKHEVEESIVRIAQKARAVGIHLVVATQSPRREVITGILKANLSSRIGFSTTSALDSNIIGVKGCENLLGNGDMMFSNQGRAPIRLQTPFISSEEIDSIVSHWRNQIYWQERVAA
jgi:S-DNA-T family DNA segregation ATPase FtsK/SpoIIIE